MCVSIIGKVTETPRVRDKLPTTNSVLTFKVRSMLNKISHYCCGHDGRAREEQDAATAVKP